MGDEGDKNDKGNENEGTVKTALEQDNALLQAEIQFLRSIPDSSPTTATIQVSELSLALRHVQDKVRLGEEELKSVNEKLGLALKVFIIGFIYGWLLICF